MKLLPMLVELGLTLTVKGDNLVVVPASELTDPLRDLIRENKTELLAAVRDAERCAVDLVAAINRCCDMRGDDAANRAGLIDETVDFTPEQQRDLIEHFKAETAIWRAATGQADK